MTISKNTSVTFQPCYLPVFMETKEKTSLLHHLPTKENLKWF